jgi:thiamine biosynthesis lipoprotein
LKKLIAGLEVDLSSIASGWTIDQLAKLLIDRGVKDFMVELGGEIRARGKRGDGTPWRVAVEKPLVAKHEIELAVPLVNAALATAGGTKKFFEYDGKRYSHIIDPAIGRPVMHTLASVTVAADTCLEADGWDTPLLVLGPQRGVEVADRNGIAAVFISPPEGGSAADTMKTTAAWRKRFTREPTAQDTGEASGTR